MLFRSVVFDFIESELKDCMTLLAKKESLGGQAQIQGQWTQAGAAALLMRLYLNAEVYIGEDRYSDCATVAQDIIDGKYGAYELATRWDAPFDWNNDTCDEVIFGFPADQGYSYWHYQGDTYWWTVPARARYYFNDSKCKAGDLAFGENPAGIDTFLFDRCTGNDGICLSGLYSHSSRIKTEAL